MQFVSSE